MPFYKKDNTELLVSPTRVEGPGFLLDAETHTEQTYPVEGWYWFDNLDAAINGLSSILSYESVSPRKIRQALTAFGLRAQVEAAVEASDQDTKDWWKFATSFEVNHPLVIAMCTTLGVSDEQRVALFVAASAL